MDIGILGTGVVGTTLGASLVAAGHRVMLGSRSGDKEGVAEWATQQGDLASQGTFEDAAIFADVALNCTAGAHSLDALEKAGADNLSGKILIDVANPLDFSEGFPPSLLVSNKDSLGEQVQRALPDTRVVKALNTVAAEVMVEPSRLDGPHDLLICGNDAEAKSEVSRLLRDWWGWEHIVDLGDISSARGTEAYLHLWLRLMGALDSPFFNIHVQQ
jgi:hypothetical protein